MIHTAPQSFPASVQSRFSQTRDMEAAVKNLAGITDDDVKVARRAFAGLLWLAFPSPSENELAEKAGRVLDVSPRQVKNWLRCQNSAAIHYLFAIVAIAGAEAALKALEGRK